METRIGRLAAEAAERHGVEIVEIALRRGGRRWRVRIDIDRPGARGVRLDDCERVSRELGRALEEQEVMDDSYVLEVSSPGLDRPIRSDDDVRRNTGRRIEIVTDSCIDDGRRFRGVLLGVEGGELRLEVEGGREVRIPRERIVRAHQEIGLGGGGLGDEGP